MNYSSIADIVKNNLIIFDGIYKADSVLNNKQYVNIAVAISGGADSDIIMDICSKFDEKKQFKYIFFNTGIEYKATFQHLDYLEKRYGVEIIRENAIIPVPLGCKNYGQPFLSKLVSDYLSRLQRYGFKWEDKPFDDLIKQYPKCKTALKWWCNASGKNSCYNISRNKYLKEFIIDNPPTFSISDKCCNGAKKRNISNFIKKHNIDLVITGIRKAEGGVRSTTYKSCFDSNSHYGCSQYRPIFWYKKQDRKEYEQLFDIVHSKCYTEYGLERTGCCGCPFGRKFEDELEVAKKYEPKLYKAVCNIFKKSYEYTRSYIEYREKLR